MCVLLTLFVVVAYVQDAGTEDFCKLDSRPWTQYCFDPRSVDGLRRCNTYEREDVIVRPACSAPNRYSNYSLTPMRCVNGNWENVGGCNPVSAPAEVGIDGAKCTWKGVRGTCVNINRCLSAIENTLNNDPPPTCENKGEEPMICCTDCSLVNDTRQILFDKRLGILYKNGRKAHDKCIEYINELDYPCSTNRVTEIKWTLDNKKNCYNAVENKSVGNVNPFDVSSDDNNEFPHLAYLGYGSDVLSLEWKCGGSLISHNFILTAAHCGITTFHGPVTYVAVGILRWSDPPEQWQRYKVKNIIPHPDYKPPNKYNDIALIETDTPVLFKDVRPACLHVDGDPGEDAHAIASASSSLTKDLSSTQQSYQVKQDRFMDEECMLVFKPSRLLRNGYNSTTQLCYGDRMGLQSTCQGDSGGPLQSKEHYPEHCVFTILGVISFGRGCSRFSSDIENSLTIYTRVQYYVPWIESVVWP